MASRRGRETSSSGEPTASPREGADAGGLGAVAPVAPHAAATRRTLLFPRSELMRRLEPRPPEHDVEERSLFRTDEPETKTLLRAVGGYESSDEVVEDGSSRPAPSEDDVPSVRPSELSTVPTALSNGVVDDSTDSLVELSTSELRSERSVSGRFRAPPLPALRSIGRDDGAPAITDAPPPMPAAEAARSRRRMLIGLLVSHGMVAVAAALVIGSGSPATNVKAAIVREPKIVLPDRTPLASLPAQSPPSPTPAGGCATSGDARLLAAHARIGPGLEVSVLETGFGVALASGNTEAVGVRVEGSGLRIAEVVRVKAPSFVTHAVIDSGRDDEDGSLDVRIDHDEARTVISDGGDAPAFRIVARGGSILALLDDPRGVRVRSLWSVPGVRIAPAPASKANLSPGASKVADVPRRPMVPAPPLAEVVRAAGRDDGGAVVALRRGSTLWLGLTHPSLAPAGPLVAVARKGATIGSPAVVQWGSGGAVAWAERPAGEREWAIMVAGFTPDGEGGMTLGPVREVGKGMSPALAALPDGDLLLAHADGPAGAHRVVARRLDRDLEPRGEPLVVSPETTNAGQPATAIRADGRAIVAFFAADRRTPRSASVLATPLACDPGF